MIKWNHKLTGDSDVDLFNAALENARLQHILSLPVNDPVRIAAIEEEHLRVTLEMNKLTAEIYGD